MTVIFPNLLEMGNFLLHPAGRAPISDNSFIMVYNGCVREFLLNFSQNFLFKTRLKHLFPHRQPLENYHGPVR